MQIGEIKLKDNKTAILSCELPAKTVLKAALMDQSSRLRWQHNFTLDKTTGAIELSLPTLEKGTYHIWITVDGRTLIREMKITRPWYSSLFQSFSGFFH